jgi:EAL domain-containing protein (putative c-di-GMP-specific phosphodiesterase class I)
MEIAATFTATWLLSGQLKDDEPIRSVRIDSSQFVVGRRSGVSLQLANPSVSGTHAELLVEEANLYVRDLGSTNGTFVNGERINERCKLKHGDLVQFAQNVFRVGVETDALDNKTIQDDAADRALALIQFDKLMTDRSVTPHFQPIVKTVGKETLGYEILGRSRLFGLTTPQAMFSAAAVLNLEAELSRILRYEGLQHAAPLDDDALLFVNTHPSEMDDLSLLEFSLHELREAAPFRRIVLEIHEASITEIASMRRLRTALADLDIGLAYDDFGAGQARLVELVEVPPDYLKFDINLIRNIQNAAPERQRMLASLVRMVSELGIAALAEGVELEAEHQVCLEMGFAFAQGFLYGKPALPKTFCHGLAGAVPAEPCR